MATAIEREDGEPVAALLARLDALELLAASRETSRQYEGIVLSYALRVTRRRIAALPNFNGKMSPSKLARFMGVTTPTMRRIEKGKPLGESLARKIYLSLLWAIEESAEEMKHGRKRRACQSRESVPRPHGRVQPQTAVA